MQYLDYQEKLKGPLRSNGNVDLEKNEQNVIIMG